MGENEQGGMLRNVVVVGLVAIIAAVVIFAVVGLKNNMSKNTNSAVGAVATTKVPYSVVNPDVTYKKYDSARQYDYGWGKHSTHFPVVGDMPNNSWREDRLVVNSSERIYFRVDINNYDEKRPTNNDNDDMSKRWFEVYDESGNQLRSTNDFNVVYLDKDKDYTVVVKYFNNSGKTFIEREDNPWLRTTLYSGTDDGRSYRLKIKSFEAATYDDKYTK